MLPLGFVGMRGFTVIRLRPCINFVHPPLCSVSKGMRSQSSNDKGKQQVPPPPPPAPRPSDRADTLPPGLGLRPVPVSPLLPVLANHKPLPDPLGRHHLPIAMPSLLGVDGATPAVAEAAVGLARAGFGLSRWCGTRALPRSSGPPFFFVSRSI